MNVNDSEKPASQDAALDELIRPKSLREIEIERLSNLPAIPDVPPDDEAYSGVLLSDKIKYFIDKYRMIWPFNEKNLKAASYELSVGSLYGKAGQTIPLAKDEELVIEPFNVVIIRTLETLNIPRFLIARWNIRIKWAYKGLLWVGAPQVDPGFRGFLSCPLYNLSNQPVRLPYGEAFAAMDFVPTTPVVASSLQYPWNTRTRIVFEEYEKDRLESALFDMAADRIEKMDALTKEQTKQIEGLRQVLTATTSSVHDQIAESRSSIDTQTDKLRSRLDDTTRTTQTRLDTYMATTFTVLAVLFAVLGLTLNRSPDLTFLSSSAPLAAIALWFALRSFYVTTSSLGQKKPTTIWVEVGIGTLLALVLLTIQYKLVRSNNADWVSTKQAANDAKQAALEIKNHDSETKALQERLNALQEEIDRIRLTQKH